MLCNKSKELMVTLNGKRNEQLILARVQINNVVTCSLRSILYQNVLWTYYSSISSLHRKSIKLVTGISVQSVLGERNLKHCKFRSKFRTGFT